MRSRKRKLDGGFRATNRAAAGIILAMPERFGGESAGLVQWARLVTQKQDEAELFELTAPNGAAA